MKRSSLCKRFPDGVDVVITPFATVRLTPDTVLKMDAYNANWRNLSSVRGKLVRQVTDAARKAWEVGGDLETF